MTHPRNTPAAPQSGATEGRNGSAKGCEPESASGPVTALRFYSRASEVEADLFLPPHQIPAGCYQRGLPSEVARGFGEWVTDLKHGTVHLSPGDRICRASDGTRWRVDRVTFEREYAPVPGQPGHRLTGLCGLAAREAMREPTQRPANEPRWIDAAGRPWPATEENPHG